MVLFRPAGLWQEGVVTIADSVMETVCNLEMDLEMVPVLGNNRTLNKLGEKMTIKNELVLFSWFFSFLLMVRLISLISLFHRKFKLISEKISFSKKSGTFYSEYAT